MENKTAEDNREKPDFERLAEKIFPYHPSGLGTQTTYYRRLGARFMADELWNDYVTPLQARIKELEDQQRWISVEEKLPEDGVIVIVSGGIAYRTNGIWQTLTGYQYPGVKIHWEVTHWQPLPTPPPL